MTGCVGSSWRTAPGATWGRGETETDRGRLIESLIIVVGVGIFGTLTGFLANAFLAPSGAIASVLTTTDNEVEPDPSGTAAADADRVGS